jgi:hypothetical protein
MYFLPRAYRTRCTGTPSGAHIVMLLEEWLSIKGGMTVRLVRDFIFLVLFFVLLIGWLFAWLAFRVAGGLIHLLLIIAVIALILHFVRGGRRAV